MIVKAVSLEPPELEAWELEGFYAWLVASSARKLYTNPTKWNTSSYVHRVLSTLPSHQPRLTSTTRQHTRTSHPAPSIGTNTYPSTRRPWYSQKATKPRTIHVLGRKCNIEGRKTRPFFNPSIPLRCPTFRNNKTGIKKHKRNAERHAGIIKTKDND